MQAKRSAPVFDEYMAKLDERERVWRETARKRQRLQAMANRKKLALPCVPCTTFGFGRKFCTEADCEHKTTPDTCGVCEEEVCDNCGYLMDQDQD